MRIFLLNMKVCILLAPVLDHDLHVKFSQLYALEAFGKVQSLLLCTYTCLVQLCKGLERCRHAQAA